MHRLYRSRNCESTIYIPAELQAELSFSEEEDGCSNEVSTTYIYLLLYYSG